MKPRVRMLPCGEQGLVVEFGNTIDPAIHAHVYRLSKMVAARIATRILEVVPTYRSLMIYFDPLVISRTALQDEMARMLEHLDDDSSGAGMRRLITIPICYSGEFGPDLEFVARHNALTEDEVVALHTSAAYMVYMLGFTPGFPYLGGMPERIAAPRLQTPRVKVPAGSVGIAGTQTGIYSIESPGGWRLIGRTPLRLFDARGENPFLFAAGDSVRFSAITAQEYRAIRHHVDCGSYSPSIQLIAAGADHVHGH